MARNEQHTWDEYRAQELSRALPLLERLGLELVAEQVHVSGERYLMSGKKLVLIGKIRTGEERVVIKLSSDPEGRREIRNEHKRRMLLPELPFAYQKFHLPKELMYAEQDGYTIAVTEYVSQERNFLDYALQEQFTLALDAFKMQEGLHATAHGHDRALSAAFGSVGAKEYLASFHEFAQDITTSDPDNRALREALARAEIFLDTNSETIDQYSGFLTHSDFVPHNLRVRGGKVHLLDHTALQFGNKYDSWARFMNYMALYNRDLEQALATYIRQNRADEELLALKLMRIYKLGFLLKFYAATLAKTTGDLHALARLRIDFWMRILEALLTDTEVPQEVIDTYERTRDLLRSEEEKLRQRELGQLR